MYKRQGYIWELVTDEGIVDADPRITWVTVSQLNGDEDFASNQFQLLSGNNNQRQQFESYKQAQVQQQQQQKTQLNVPEPSGPNHQSQNTTDSSGIPMGLSAAEQEAYILSLSEQSAAELAAEKEQKPSDAVAESKDNVQNAENTESTDVAVNTMEIDNVVAEAQVTNTETVDMEIGDASDDEEAPANRSGAGNTEKVENSEKQKLIQSEEQRSIDMENNEKKTEIDALIVPENMSSPNNTQSIETEDDALAQRLQLQEQLGLSDEEFERMQQEQKAALEEQAKSKITSSKGGLGCFQKAQEETDAELADAIYAQQLQESYNQEKTRPNDQYGNQPYARNMNRTYNNRTSPHRRNVSQRRGRGNYKKKRDDSCIVL